MSSKENKLKILVTGAHGQLGADLVSLLRIKSEVIGIGRSEMDITELKKVRDTLIHLKPNIVIHSAAHTAVDQAEIEQDEAFRVNAYGTRNIALISEEIGAKLCFLSTDYVFDGESRIPYSESDRPHPRTVYGKSKLAGEEFVRTVCKKSFIVRTSWLYGAHGSNFVKNMLKLSKERNIIHVVNDQFGSPTYTVDLCYFIDKLIKTNLFGTYHTSNTGSCSWYEFAKKIFEITKLDFVNVIPCKTEDFPRSAARPKFSVLDHVAMRCNGFPTMRPWQAALKEFLQTYYCQP